ncbi:MAG: leucine--tRNA ligase [Bdellovibrionales bacterium]|jgi:leucyl-tRNA synthetase|nr:leucine--tRNA ligase [Bdellovibrionales bacterium]
MTYDHKAIDSKWQKKWDEAQAFRVEDARTTKKPKYYALDMFPYPSGYGLHVGHLASYTPTDVLSRYKRAKGFNVLHPMGYDAFGLPAEQFAIQTGIHPAVTTDKSIEAFRATLKTMGYSFDWSREVSTADPKFYKWTQFIFTKLYEKGLAYQKDAPVNWCPALRTVLANDEVVDGKSERGGHPVIKVPMKQWMLKITDYAERLIADLDKVQWPDRTVEAQRNWIGKSEGANVKFQIAVDASGKPSSHEALEIFTTRPDTLFGVTFMVVSPEHPCLQVIVPEAQRAVVKAYQDQAARKSEVDRKSATEKTGVFTGAYAVNPFSGKAIPVWTADYVMMDYGTGAIMAVPGHDERDFEFAQAFKLDVTRVLDGGELPFTGEGTLVNSEFLNGLEKSKAIPAAIAEIEKRALGKKVVQYKLRDWLFSRQRYWGEPFPLVRFPDGEIKTVPLNELPVLLPEVADYQPSEKGEAPLARNLDFVKYTGAAGGGTEGFRETDTMPGSAGSSWYFLRYCDPHNDDAFCDFEAQKYWMPVDVYVGGPEHTVGHLLYARFWQKVLFDAGLVSHEEPFKRLVHQGMILGPDGEKMSKSRGNVINPDTLRDKFGADVVRTFVMFLGPMSADKPWQDKGIGGVERFLDRIWRLCVDENGGVLADDSAVPEELNRLLHKTIKKVGDDIEVMSFNTAVSALMILLNDLYKTECRSKKVLVPLLQLVAPFAPHMAEELWEKLGQSGFVSTANWPEYDSALTVDSVVSIGVQVNGKARGVIELEKDADEATALQKALELSTVQNAMGGKSADKVIYKAGRILNLIVKI